MRENTITLDFGNSFEGQLKTASATVDIGYGTGNRLGSYDMLLGALGCCFYYHTVRNAKKAKVEYERVHFNIHGLFRQAVPDTLEQVEMMLTAYGVKDRPGFERIIKEATGQCSVHATISKVADIKLHLKFEE